MTDAGSFSLDRRVFLQLTAASAALSGCGALKEQKRKHVAVIGAGIVGASIAYHLMRERAQVTLIDRYDLATRASRGTLAWINASWAKQPRHYHAFTQRSVSSWRQWHEDLGMPVRFGGSLEWFSSLERQAKLAQQIAEQREWGEPARMVDAREFGRLEPNFTYFEAQQAAFSENDGAVDPVLATQILVQQARDMGANVKTNCHVTGARVGPEGGAVLETSCGDLSVDRYVLATGADPDAVRDLAGMELPQRSTPGVIVLTKPMPRLVYRVISAPGVHFHQRDDGRIVVGEQAGAPDNAAHAERLQAMPNRFPDPAIAQQHAERVLAPMQSYVPQLRQAEVEDVYIGWRPLPIDGHPVLGAPKSRPSAYLAIMHSGVSLAPIVGQVAAREILYDQADEALSRYRPDRDFEVVKRY